MSGGTFDYQQHRIFDIAEQIKEELLLDKTIKPYEAIYPWDIDKETGRLSSGTDVYHSNYSPETVENLLKTYRYLLLAYEYSHQVGLMLSADTGEETFNNRCEEIETKIENEFHKFAEQIRSKVPETLDRCIFCKYYQYLYEHIPSCKKIKKTSKNPVSDRIKDPLKRTCELFSRFSEDSNID